MCPACRGRIKAGKHQLTREDDGYCHVACTLKRRKGEIEEEDQRAAALNDESERVPADDDPTKPIFKHVKTKQSNLFVRARAGSGKTRLIIDLAAKRARKGERALAVTLNVNAKDELRDRARKEGLTLRAQSGNGGDAWQFDGRTFHSIGMSALQRRREEGRDKLSAITEDDDDREEAARAADGKAAAEAPTQDSLLPNKSKMILKLLCPKTPEDSGRAQHSLEVAVFGSFVTKLVSLAKNNAIGCDGGDKDNAATWSELVDQHSLDRQLDDKSLEKRLSDERLERVMHEWPTKVAREQKAMRLAKQVLKASVAIARDTSWTHPGDGTVHTQFDSDGGKKKAWSFPAIDYDDMLYMPLRDNVELYPDNVDWLCVDEAQDTNKARMLIAQGIIEECNARALVVGDDMQALYGFSGAHTDALEELKNMLSCKEFPLPICWRCPTSHLKLANDVIEQAGAEDDECEIRPRPNAPPGNIFGKRNDEDQRADADFTTHPVEPGTQVVLRNAAKAAAAAAAKRTRVILARRNAPLLALVWALAARGVACRMLGRDTLRNKVLATLKEIGAEDLDELEAALPGWVAKKEEEAQQQQRGSAGDADEQTHKDLADCVRVTIEELKRYESQGRQQTVAELDHTHQQNVWRVRERGARRDRAADRRAVDGAQGEGVAVGRRLHPRAQRAADGVRDGVRPGVGAAAGAQRRLRVADTQQGHAHLPPQRRREGHEDSRVRRTALRETGRGAAAEGALEA